MKGIKEQIKIVKDKIVKKLQEFKGTRKEMKLDGVKLGEKVGCKICGKEIADFIFIDNKISTEQNGKYCKFCYAGLHKIS